MSSVTLQTRSCIFTVMSIECGVFPRVPQPISRVNSHVMYQTRESLIQRVRDPKDFDSWQEFVSIYRPLLMAYLKKRGLSDADADEVVADTLTLLLRELPKFSLDHGRGRFRTWLWRVSNSAVIDWSRRRARGRRNDQLRKYEEEKRQFAGEGDPSHSEPDEEWVQDYRRHILQHVLRKVSASVSPKTWECFQRHIVQRESAKVVGESLGMQANAVYVNASRILTKVREECQNFMESLSDESPHGLSA